MEKYVNNNLPAQLSRMLSQVEPRRGNTSTKCFNKSEDLVRSFYSPFESRANDQATIN